MAETEGERNGTGKKTSPPPSEQGSQEDHPTELTGWMLKRTKVTHKWKRQYFHLRSNELLYGDTEQLGKTISLVSAEIGECSIDNKDFVFRVKPASSKRTFYLQAENEATMHNWMQAICFAKAAGKSDGGPSEACSIQ